MRIAFFGIHYACHYFHIGGTDSFVRRIAVELAGNHADTVDYVLYGESDEADTQIMPGLRMRDFSTFSEAKKALLDYDHVITIYLPPRDRLRFMLFRATRPKNIKFHVVYFSWPDSRIKRKLMFADSRLVPYNGRIFTISPRQYNVVKTWCPDPMLIWPPVPTEYFLSPQSKPKSSRLRVTWVGRIDPGKGVNQIVDLFQKLSSNPTIELKVCAHRWDSCTKTKELQQWFMEQEKFEYINTEYTKHSADVEQLVCEILKNTDIFILPYEKLSSTIDMPLLLLESMAALCTIIFKPQGNMTKVYGSDQFVLPEMDFVKKTLCLIEQIASRIPSEQKRIFDRNQQLCFGVTTVAKRFRDALLCNPVSEIIL